MALVFSSLATLGWPGKDKCTGPWIKRNQNMPNTENNHLMTDIESDAMTDISPWAKGIIQFLPPKERGWGGGWSDPGFCTSLRLVNSRAHVVLFWSLWHLMFFLGWYLSASSLHINVSRKVLQMPFPEIRIHMKKMATRKRCKLYRTGPDFENVIKKLLCVWTFHTRIGGDLTPGIINRGRPANAEQMGLPGSAKHCSVFPPGPLDSR